jgi:histidinol dehydrogenase
MWYMRAMLRIVAPDDPARNEVERNLSQRQSLIPGEVATAVRAIIEDVQRRGDAAVRELTARFDRRDLVELELAPDDWQQQSARVAPSVREAIDRARDRIVRFHEPQRHDGYVLTEPGVRLGLRVQPLERVGLYVPGGTARYPSSVLMTAVPARVAGVREIVMVTPGPSPETLYAAHAAGVSRVFTIGGAQAVAALAFGTESVPRVDKIVGPGNAFVAEAKRQVFGAVDIDAVAGPSEVLIIADASADPVLVAADLLAQAEHDVDAYALLVTDSPSLAQAVNGELERQLADLPRRDIASESLRRHGVAFVTRTIDEALELADRYAPEHLELCIVDARTHAERLRHAGAIFIGPHTPEAAGDYVAGPNHVLPTGATARWASPLGVYDFVKHVSLLEYEAEALAAQAADIEALAEVEGLHAHGRSITRRIKR